MRDRRRTLIVVVGVAVASLAAGLWAGSRLLSPADAAANTEPPEASDITVPVEFRTLETQVATRGDASFAGAVELSVETSGLSMPPIVTGALPETGQEIREGDVVLQIVGRPVVVLVGDLPTYRTLRPGMNGPDVVQLEKALDRLGFDPGDVDDRYTTHTSAAVAKLFDTLGYQPPEAGPEVEAELDAATAAVSAAEDEVRAAQQVLDAASAGPSKTQELEADQAVSRAERELRHVEQAGDKAAIATAEDQLELANARRDDLLEGPDVSLERSAVEVATERLAEARQALEDAEAAAATPLPASELVYVADLPRRVDDVMVNRGEEISGPVLSVSGADIVVTANVDAADRESLSEDMTVAIDLPNGDQVEGVITEIAAVDDSGADAGGEQPQNGFDVVIEPQELTNAQVHALKGANVRVTVPITSTEGDVLAVPLAAVTAGPGGESRVEVSRDGETTLVTVELGLVADGYAEVTPVDDDLTEGDLVVVGQ